MSFRRVRRDMEVLGELLKLCWRQVLPFWLISTILVSQRIQLIKKLIKIAENIIQTYKHQIYQIELSFITRGRKAPESRFRLFFLLLLLLGAGRRPSQGFASVFSYY